MITEVELTKMTERIKRHAHMAALSENDDDREAFRSEVQAGLAMLASLISETINVGVALGARVQLLETAILENHVEVGQWTDGSFFNRCIQCKTRFRPTEPEKHAPECIVRTCGG